uniref:Putative deoxyguanosinetriphosphate triphosphohydrolase n=1 Tax=Magnetococcus massalia (strain MO-1) TaxID=451514 RepID=A0A1S7LDF2_MAGMO|nr:putative deoxyguanosinetriphosphate triphosphohydrolase [Candidatus Magnetococcus massalia]
MSWDQLLATSRLKQRSQLNPGPRHPFEVDLDRVTFSASFRRLKDKTQVHALPDNDHVRNRLTHSIETASVGRSLGVLVGNALNQQGVAMDSAHMGYVVQAACLSHDIGNPPFGHSGEEAIRSWFADKSQTPWFLQSLTAQEKLDFLHFEGNAQGFRILTQLEMGRRAGGLRLSHAVLGAFSKYPRQQASCTKNPHNDAARKKNGLFCSEVAIFREVAEATGLKLTGSDGSSCWQRHPMAYLMEAADDICYGVVDIEDGYELGFLRFEEAVEILAEIAGTRGSKLDDPPLEQIRYLRAEAMHVMIQQSAKAFMQHQEAILDGSFAGTLPAATEVGSKLKLAKQKAREAIYHAEPVVLKIASGHRVLHALLDIFHPVVMAMHEAAWRAEDVPGHDGHMARLMGPEILEILRREPTPTRVAALRVLTDFISSMTDGHAIRLFRKLHGGSIL